MLEVARDRRVDAEVGQEDAGAAGVLAGDERDLLQDAERAQRDVLEIAEGSRDDVERAGRSPPSGGERGR